MKRYYDKMLHVLVTFFLVVCMVQKLSLPWYLAVTIVLILQACKTMWNYSRDWSYTPCGDWLANIGGYVIAGLFIWL